MPKKLLYQVIMDYLKEKIANGDYQSEDLLPSEFELTKEFNVSRITAQKALDELENEGLIYRIKGKGSLVRQKKELPQTPAASKVTVVALIMPFGSGLGGGLLTIQGATSALNQRGFYLTVHNSHYDSEEERNLINSLIQDGVAGIILYPFYQYKNLDLIHRSLLNGYPIVTIDKYYDGLSISSVTSDFFTGSYQAASYLIQSGHRDLVFMLDHPLEFAVGLRDRYFGFCQALKEHDLPITDQNLRYIDNFSNESILAILKSPDFLAHPLSIRVRSFITEILDGKIRCTAIHTLHDYLAMLVLKVALSMGLNIPKDLSIIGFDNIENVNYLEVPLTTIEQNFLQIGNAAGNLISDMIVNSHQPTQKIQVPTRLVIRNSTMNMMKSPDGSAFY